METLKLVTIRHANTKGFSLIEAVIVIVVLSVLTAIAVPSYLNQASRARELEARQNLVHILNKQQQYHQENGGQFATGWDELAIGFADKSTNYDYSLFSANDTAGIIINSNSKDLKSYLGGIKLVTKPATDYFIVKCQSIKRGDALKKESLLVGANQIRCGKRVNDL